jgi:hypothetical protein
MVHPPSPISIRFDALFIQSPTVGIPIPKAAPMDVGFWLGYCGKNNGGSLYSEYGLISRHYGRPLMALIKSTSF